MIEYIAKGCAYAMKLKNILQISAAVILSGVVMISVLPFAGFTASAGKEGKYAVYDPYEQFFKKAEAAAASDFERNIVDYTGIDFSVRGSYYSAAAGTLNNTYREGGRLWLSKVDADDPNGNNNNCNFVLDSEYNNAIGSRQAINASGGAVTLSFNAPVAGKYLIVPRGIDAADGKSLYLYDPQHYDGEAPEYFEQTFTVINGGNVLFKKTLRLNNYMPVSDDIPENMTVTLGTNEKLDFIFTAGNNWGRTTLLANFEIRLIEYSAASVSGVYFEKSNYITEKSEVIKLSPVVIPATAAEQGVEFKDYDKDIISIAEDGSVTAKKSGITKVTVITKDGGFTAETTVCVYDKTTAGIFKLNSLFNSARELFKDTEIYTDKINDIKSVWQVKYKNGNYVNCETVSYDPWGGGNYGIVFWPNTAPASSSAAGLMQYMSSGKLVSELKYGRQDASLRGAALEFTAPENGIYSFAGERTVKLADSTVRYMNGDDVAKSAKFTVNICLNGDLLSSLELDYAKQETEMPILNGLQLKAGDKITAELETDIWEKGAIDISPVVIKVLDKMPENPVTEVLLNKNDLELYVSESASLIASVKPENATNKNIVFSTDNAETAVVSENGTVKAVSPGVAVITAASAENPKIRAACKVTVKKQKESFSPTNELWAEVLNSATEENKNIRFSYDGHFTAGYKSDGAYTDFPYAVRTNWGNPRAVILTNDKNENGSSAAKQTVAFYDNTVEVGSYTDNSSVYIGFKAKENGYYTLSSDTVGGLIKLTTPAYTNPAELVEWGEDKPFYVSVTKNGKQIWPSGNRGYELRPGGNLSVKMPTLERIKLYKGDALRIEVTGQSGIPSRHATVNFNFTVAFDETATPAVSVTEIKMKQKLAELSIGETAALKAEVRPENADNKNVKYLSSDPNTVSVDGTGVITGLRAGNAVIYAVSEENENIRDYCSVRVTEFKIIDYNTDELLNSLQRQIGGFAVTKGFETEYDTNWSFEYSADGTKSWTPLKMLTTYDWRNEGIVSAYSFGRSSQEIAGLERLGTYYQPYLATDNADMSLTFTATRSGTYRISPDIRNNRIYVPETYVNGRIPRNDMDKEYEFTVYRNDTVLFKTALSGNKPSVLFPEISDLFLNSGDKVRFVLSDCPASSSQMDIYFSPFISLVKPDTVHRAPIAEDQSFELRPGESCSGKIKAVSPNGYSLSFNAENGSAGGKFTLKNDGGFIFGSSEKGIFEKRVKITDSRGKSCIVKLTFTVANKYDCVEIISALLLEADKKGVGKTGTAKPVSFENSVWKFQYTYDGLTYANGTPKYYSTDLAEITVNGSWWGYYTYTNDMPQACVLETDGVPSFEIMAGNKPWGTNPIGAASFFAPNDATYLLKPSALFDYFKLTADLSKPDFKQPVKVWIVKNGKKIWPEQGDCAVLSRENIKENFPSFKVAMHKDDVLRICVSGHYENERLNTVAFCPIMYDIGGYNSALDPNPEPEGGKIITDDDGEPMKAYEKFSLSSDTLKLLNYKLSAPVTDKKLLSKNKTQVAAGGDFEALISGKSEKNAAAYRFAVYRKTEDGYTVFSDDNADECNYTSSGLSEGKYTAQIEALDEYGQTTAVYCPTSFEVSADGKITVSDNMRAVILTVCIGGGIILLTVAAILILKCRKRSGDKNA